MREAARGNAVRSTIVVMVAAASSYLTWRLIAVPFMEKAEAALAKSEDSSGPSDDSRRVDDDWEAVDSKPTEGYLKE
ncbi:hypothetical protein QQ045_007769 [Rhodiola kirilowii]